MTTYAVNCDEYLGLIASHRGYLQISDSFRRELDDIYHHHLYLPVPREDVPTLLEYFNVYTLPKFDALLDSTRYGTLQSLFGYLSRVPASIRNQVRHSRVAMGVVDRNLWEHPEFSNDPFFAPGTRWTGACSRKAMAVKCRDPLVSIHEMGHALDNTAGEREESHTGPFYDASKGTRSNWTDPYFASLRESYAEGFSWFFESPQKRAQLKQDHPGIHDYFVQRLGTPPVRVPLTPNSALTRRASSASLPKALLMRGS